MINEKYFQKTIYNELRSYTPLVTIIGNQNNIKEAQWQGTNFIYPAVRFNVLNMSPVGDTECRLSQWNVSFYVESYSEKDSSAEVRDMSYHIGNALFGKRLTAYDVNDVAVFKLMRIDFTTSDDAMRITERLWMQRLYFKTFTYEV